MKHTPTPWNVNQGRITADGVTVATSYAPSNATVNSIALRDANAAFIVRACNAHDELVEILERARGVVQMVDDAEGGQIDLLSAIDARLAKARGEA